MKLALIHNIQILECIFKQVSTNCWRSLSSWLHHSGSPTYAQTVFRGWWYSLCRRRGSCVRRLVCVWGGEGSSKGLEMKMPLPGFLLRSHVESLHLQFRNSILAKSSCLLTLVPWCISVWCNGHGWTLADLEVVRYWCVVQWCCLITEWRWLVG